LIKRLTVKKGEYGKREQERREIIEGRDTKKD